MKKKNIFKIVVDTIMLILFLMMFNHTLISQAFHEIGGIALVALFILHFILNFKGFKGCAKGTFKKGTGAGVKISFIVDILLCISFLFFGFSGIMISKVVLTGISGSQAFFKPAHEFAAAFALILMGIHLGLHWSYVLATIGIRFKGKAAAIVTTVIVVLIGAFGIYSMSTTSYLRFISMPFSSSQGSGHGDMMQGNAAGAGNGQHLRDGSGQGKGQGNGSGNTQAQAPQSNADGQPPQSPSDGTQAAPPQGVMSGAPEGAGMEHGGQSLGPVGILKFMASYLSMIALFAIITFYIKKLFLKGKTKKSAKAPAKDKK